MYNYNGYNNSTHHILKCNIWLLTKSKMDAIIKSQQHFVKYILNYKFNLQYLQ